MHLSFCTLNIQSYHAHTRTHTHTSTHTDTGRELTSLHFNSTSILDFFFFFFQYVFRKRQKKKLVLRYFLFGREERRGLASDRIRSVATVSPALAPNLQAPSSPVLFLFLFKVFFFRVRCASATNIGNRQLRTGNRATGQLATGQPASWPEPNLTTVPKATPSHT